MKLRWSPTSPFVRKVVVMMKEKGIEDQIKKEKSNPLSAQDRAATPSPLGQIPSLITDNGDVIYDSPVIIEYLDTVFDGPTMLPPAGEPRWKALRRQALADGMIASLVFCFVENLKKPEKRSKGLFAHNKAIVLNGVSSLQTEVSEFRNHIDIGIISIGVALSFVNQTFPAESWHQDYIEIGEWFDDFSQRSSMKDTTLIDVSEFH